MYYFIKYLKNIFLVYLMNLTDKICNLSLITLNGGYVAPDIDITIWLLEKCNSIESRTKLGELYLLKKYNISFKSIKDMIQQNINQQDIYSKYLLANIYLINNKYDYVYTLLNTESTLQDFEMIETTQNTSYIHHLLFFMGMYILDKTSNIELGIQYLSIFFKDSHKNIGIFKYIQYKYCNKPLLNEAYRDGDLHSCFLLGDQTNDIKYYNEFINRYNPNFYMNYLNCDFEVKYIPTKNKLRIMYDQCKLYITKSQEGFEILSRISNAINNILKDIKLKQSIKIIQKYISHTELFSQSLKYKISIAGVYKNIEPSNLFFDKMLECINTNYLDSKYYLGIMYFKGYGTNKNNNISLELLSDYQTHSANPLVDVYYYLTQIYYEQTKYTDLIELYNENYNIIDTELESNLLGKFYYTLSLVFMDDTINNIKLTLKYFEKSMDCNNLDAYFKMGVLLSEGSLIPLNNNQAREYFTYASNHGHHDSLCNLAYFYYNGISIDQNKDTAISLWKKLAELNNSNALYYLGVYYKSINDNIYITYIKRSAELNNKDALYNLAQFYNEIEKRDDYLKCLNESAKNGNNNAVNDLYKIALEYKENDNTDQYLNLLNICSNYGNQYAKHDLIDYTNIQDLRKI